jgi:hypothetical protein
MFFEQALTFDLLFPCPPSFGLSIAVCLFPGPYGCLYAIWLLPGDSAKLMIFIV